MATAVMLAIHRDEHHQDSTDAGYTASSRIAMLALDISVLKCYGYPLVN